MDSLKLSVIIPVYNTEKYLQQCVDCMLLQTMENIEFVFVNDASPDDSIRILRDNEKKYPGKIRVIDSPENRRQGGARNLGLRAAKGDYIGFCDSDDLIRPDTYERLYEEAKRKAADASFSWMIQVGEDASLEEALAMDAEKQRPEWTRTIGKLNGKELTDEDRMELMRLPVGGSVTWIYRREFLIENELFFPEKTRYEDNGWGMLVKALLKKIWFVDNPCYYYRQNLLSTTQSRNSPGVYERITVEENNLEEFRRRGLYERFLPALEYAYITRRTFMTYGFFMYTYDDLPKDIMKELMRSLKERFPKWKKNRYYQQHSFLSRWKDGIKYHFPIDYGRMIRFMKHPESN